MKTKGDVIYRDDKGEMDGFDESRILGAEEQARMGLPTPEEAGKIRLVRKPRKAERINVRLAAETLEGLKTRAAEAGMPYQTLAASVLHLVATGRLRLDLVPGKK